MNRRSFLAALGAAPVVAAGAVKMAAAKPDPSASATFRMQSGYTPGKGWRSGIGLQTRANDGGAYRDAGIRIDATASGQSHIVLNADEFSMSEPVRAPFIFDSGVARFTTLAKV